MTDEPVAPTVFFVGNNHPKGQVLCADGEFRTLKEVLEGRYALETFETYESAEQKAMAYDKEMNTYFPVYVSSSGSSVRFCKIYKQKAPT